jgi:hypothetical protein
MRGPGIDVRASSTRTRVRRHENRRTDWHPAADRHPQIAYGAGHLIAYRHAAAQRVWSPRSQASWANPTVAWFWSSSLPAASASSRLSLSHCSTSSVATPA